ncbi:hypothetical protein DMN91_008447 [Ooceraea biroi]|uniref:NADH dehydrogenase [ubiquinone] 1 alpha subcomplex subunit 7 n=1 Tax=Ooceraea biroi TaxID=2015173 RepID=A0A026WT22_OOCBI|nr:NADH dehydrogenase [ubiquinone] 1 alpha subcomplex subunit 7 [Ooceraea biroi]XP_026827481.1 NADH dehydrogenase [ubiquinone] 1 alpha subcomplex subunit 7 [Ooceraea biroi]EZA59098.1 NADH dehydrogenase [ubiquinone] 1 alpha subcomplex subunit [Ooceraea biroi]RLU19888.1 hypothetical protein DMN91_008447 [Ooceraea biroi]
MSGSTANRAATPIIKLIQAICRGRKAVIFTRFANEQSKRTQPPPHVPGGPYDKTSQIYYYTRDGRREVQPPMLISGSKQIGTESKSSQEYCTPGKAYNWDS